MLCKQWMQNLEAFQAAIESDSSYHSTLTRSLSLVLDEFYKNLHSVGVSAVSGTGMEAFFSAIEASADEYMDNYKADLDKRWAEKERLEEELRQENMDKLRRGMEKSDGNTMVLSRGLEDEGVGEIVMDEEEEEFELFSEEEEKDEA
ncbi:GPN-loop GTPase 1-like protein [Cinnamomum micranthum f. kanehirae]|uniref:GPN-loop GTPase n=1 Tax=Cinnamomum micranthum f. kanehirae TaxID=337451 RepID=A0A3S4PT70_9MAGN|nr:GPN-loop GTPase 1-like protein [Cinnamomum micranthum f. kanehirae]